VLFVWKTCRLLLEFSRIHIRLHALDKYQDAEFSECRTGRGGYPRVLVEKVSINRHWVAELAAGETEPDPAGDDEYPVEWGAQDWYGRVPCGWY
jgi:hypothetical protein